MMDFVWKSSINVSLIQDPYMIKIENKILCLKFKSIEVNAICIFGKKNLENIDNHGGSLLSCRIVSVGVGVIIRKRENEGKYATLQSLMKMKMKESGGEWERGGRRERVHIKNSNYFKYFKLKQEIGSY